MSWKLIMGVGLLEALRVNPINPIPVTIQKMILVIDPNGNRLLVVVDSRKDVIVTTSAIAPTQSNFVRVSRLGGASGTSREIKVIAVAEPRATKMKIDLHPKASMSKPPSTGPSM
jgi:hypothetical protein